MKKAKEILQESIVVDAHLDLAYDLYRKRQRGIFGTLKDDYLPDLRSGYVNVIVSSVYVDEIKNVHDCVKAGMEQIGALLAEMRLCDAFLLCTSYQMVLDAIRAGKIAVILSFEGAEAIGDNADLLYAYQRLGVRGLGLCWSRPNLAAEGALYTTPEGLEEHGLIEYGKKLVSIAEDGNMFFDISHLNDPGIEMLFSLTDRMIIASHSACRSLNPTKRNITDQQIRKLAARGGVIGINGVSSIVADHKDELTLSKMVDHMDHIMEVGGEDCLGLGFDFAGRIMENETIFVNQQEIPVLDILGNYSGVLLLVEECLKRGYTEKQLKKILGGNFMRVFKQCL